MDKLRLFATAAFGVESVVARELKHLGYGDTHTDNGRIFFEGDFEAVCRTNLWLRSAERVHIVLSEFTATTFSDLFDATASIPWEDWLPKDAEFPVTGKCVKSVLMSISDCQSIIKKAIVERLKKVYKLETFPETGSRYHIDFSITKDKVTISLDTTGEGLHKRGYRSLGYEAPIKETLAAAMLMISRWTPGRHLIDPFCGSGTIPIEAALMAMNKAPGIDREFDCQEWSVIPKKIWYNALDEARDLIKPVNEITIQGFDINPEAISMANYHARQAGVSDIVHFQVRDMRDISSKAKYGFIITNPPYGQRLGEKKENSLLYRDMGKTFSKLPTWSYYIINADPDFEKHFGRKADKNRKLFNGGLLCYYYQYFGPKPE
ncbi:MAG TPA: class I SAM-dependent RNA methyltransferase [Clostridiaceae bacterium]|nr:class I SAM-dependent RNA methyltransferase [Clostridiaceae bacterium]